MYELVDKYLRRLDTELHKFKCELEADNKGITEVLEKRSLELDTPGAAQNIISVQQKENRFERYLRYMIVGCSNLISSCLSSRPRSEKRRDSSTSLPTSFSEKRQALASAAIVETRHPVPPQTPVVSNPQPTVSYNIGHIGAGPAIAAAASQAIAATQQVFTTHTKFVFDQFYLQILFMSADATGKTHRKPKGIVRSN